MHFDPNAGTLTLGRKDCTWCRGTGHQPGTRRCPDCQGTGAGPRGKVRGCQTCFGRGHVFNPSTRVACSRCMGDPRDHDVESFTDFAPAQALAHIAQRVVVHRVDRSMGWIEQMLGGTGMPCWTAIDYGQAWTMSDDRVEAMVREQFLGENVQACKVVHPYGRDDLTAQVCSALVVELTPDGYVVRAVQDLADVLA